MRLRRGAQLAEYERWKAATSSDDQLVALRAGKVPISGDPIIHEVFRKDHAILEAQRLTSEIDTDFKSMNLASQDFDVDKYVREKAQPYVARMAGDERRVFTDHSAYLKENGVPNASHLSLVPAAGSGKFVVVKWDGGVINLPTKNDAYIGEEGKYDRPAGFLPRTISELDIQQMKAGGAEHDQGKAREEQRRKSERSKYAPDRPLRSLLVSEDNDSPVTFQEPSPQVAPDPFDGKRRKSK